MDSLKPFVIELSLQVGVEVLTTQRVRLDEAEANRTYDLLEKLLLTGAGAPKIACEEKAMAGEPLNSLVARMTGDDVEATLASIETMINVETMLSLIPATLGNLKEDGDIHLNSRIDVAVAQVALARRERNRVVASPFSLPAWEEGEIYGEDQ
jgi:hypothetical protein